jgi:hypothetical protein
MTLEICDAWSFPSPMWSPLGPDLCPSDPPADGEQYPAVDGAPCYDVNDIYGPSSRLYTICPYETRTCVCLNTDTEGTGPVYYWSCYDTTR